MGIFTRLGRSLAGDGDTKEREEKPLRPAKGRDPSLDAAVRDALRVAGVERVGTEFELFQLEGKITAGGLEFASTLDLAAKGQDTPQGKLARGRGTSFEEAIKDALRIAGIDKPGAEFELLLVEGKVTKDNLEYAVLLSLK